MDNLFFVFQLQWVWETFITTYDVLFWQRTIICEVSEFKICLVCFLIYTDHVSEHLKLSHQQTEEEPQTVYPSESANMLAQSFRILSTPKAPF